MTDSADIPYKQWLCVICGFIYDEAKGWPNDGIAPGTRWQDVPEDWACPDCLVGKADFDMIEMPAVSSPNPTETATTQTVNTQTDTPQTATDNRADNSMAAGPIVIIGSGYAGYNLAEKIRQLDAKAELVILTQDSGMHYSKPALSNGLAKQQSPQHLISEKPLDRANRLNLRIINHCHVEHIDTNTQVLHTHLGAQPYGRLVLATGAKPIDLSLSGDGNNALLSVNNLDDYRVYRDKLTRLMTNPTVPRVVIIGDGLIGCEFANDLISQNVQVDVVGLGAWPMQRLLPKAIGQGLQDSLAQQGVGWHLDTCVTHIQTQHNEDDLHQNPHQGLHQGLHPYRISLQNGNRLEADLIISAVGLQANTGLAKQAGIACDKGIKVDDCLATNQNNIYALGDCIEINGQLMPYIAPIYWGIQALAQTLTGQPTCVDYPLMTVMVKTPAYPMTILPPPVHVQGHWQVETLGANNIAQFIDDKGQLQGFVLTGSAQDDRAKWVEKVSAT